MFVTGKKPYFNKEIHMLLTACADNDVKHFTALNTLVSGF